MNPGNGIETKSTSRLKTHQSSFTLMNPGNGIETFDSSLTNAICEQAFTLMNPGNGIETSLIIPLEIGSSSLSH